MQMLQGGSGAAEARTLPHAERCCKAAMRQRRGGPPWSSETGGLAAAAGAPVVLRQAQGRSQTPHCGSRYIHQASRSSSTASCPTCVGVTVAAVGAARGKTPAGIGVQLRLPR